MADTPSEDTPKNKKQLARNLTEQFSEDFRRTTSGFSERFQHTFVISIVILVGLFFLSQFVDKGADFTEKLFEIGKNDSTPIVIGGIMVVLALYFILNYRNTVFKPLMTDIQNVKQVIAASRDPSKFYLNFKEIDAVLTDTKSFKDGWRELKETMQFTTSHLSDDEVVHNTKRPHEYLNETSIAQSGKDIRSLEFLPSIFVGSGLVLTFIGLTIALFVTSGAISAGENTAIADRTFAVSSALQNLIKVSAFKFITSIAGIGCSIAITIYSRIKVSDISERLLKIQNQLERGMVHLSAERIQMGLKEEFSSLSESIKGGFTDAITDVAGGELGKFTEEMRGINEELRKSQEMVEKFGESYREQLEEVKEAFTSTSQEMANSSQGFQSELESNQKKFSQEMGEEYEQKFSRLSQLFTSSFDDAQTKFSGFQDSVKTSLEATTKVLESTSNEIIQNSRSELARSATDMGESVRAIFEDAVNELGQLKDTINTSYDTTVETLGRANEAFLEEAKRQMEDQSGSMEENYRKLGEKVSEIIQNASDGFNQNIGSSFQLISDASQKAVEEHNTLQNRTGEIVENVSNVVGELSTVREEIARAGDKTSGEISVIGNKLDSAATAISNFGEGLQSQSDKELRKLETTIRDLETAMKDQLSETTSSANSTKEVAKKLETVISRYTEEATSKQADLNTAVEKLSTALKEATAEIKAAKSGGGLGGLFGGR